MKDKEKKAIERIIEILEAKPYVAYTLYGDILHDSDEIAQMLKEVLEKECGSKNDLINIYKEKIKAKVIEIKDRPVKDEFITATQGKLNTIIDMESLLEKE